VADYIIRLGAAAGPHAPTIESPMLGENREAVIGRLSALVAALEARASSVRIAADEFCNSLSDIEAFADRRAAHLIQIKMPDLGGVDQSIEAVRACHERGLLALLGGSCNETDWSSRLTVHIVLAMEADLIYNKPGFGVDEGHMVVHNEMARTLALLNASGVATAAMNPAATA
jgi:methylaspartate ammonia-lyase